MATPSRPSSSKQSRRAAIERETRRREQALAVPPERSVFVLREHYCDEGGPCGFWTREYHELAGTDRFDFDAWRERIRSGPVGWVPPEIVCQDDPEFPTQSGPGDFGRFQDLMIFSGRSAHALRPFLEPCGVFLPVCSELGNYVGFRLDAVVDALDADRTRASWCLMPDLGARDRANSIYAYAFHTEKLGEAAIFRVPQHFEILVLKPFADVVRSSLFTGFRFCRVWPTSMTGLWWHQKENWF
jgi:hypothetical protein